MQIIAVLGGGLGGIAIGLGAIYANYRRQLRAIRRRYATKESAR